MGKRHGLQTRASEDNASQTRRSVKKHEEQSDEYLAAKNARTPVAAYF